MTRTDHQMKLWLPWQRKETLFLGLLLVSLWKGLISEPGQGDVTHVEVNKTNAYVSTTVEAVTVEAHTVEAHTVEAHTVEAHTVEADTGSSDEGIGPFDFSFLETIIITAVTLGVPILALSASLLAFWYKKKFLNPKSSPLVEP